MGPPLIVVPDGLAADAQGRPLAQPSFVYRAALDRAAALAAGQTVYLAPANRFGGAVTEQEAGAAYLRARGVGPLVVAETPPDAPYIDTWGNAALLRHHLESARSWPLAPALLCVAERHAARAALCFRRNGFLLAGVAAASYAQPDDEGPGAEGVVPRLWYYRAPLAHRLYEWAATARDALRPA